MFTAMPSQKEKQKVLAATNSEMMDLSQEQIVDFTLRLDVSNSEVLELLRGKKSRVADSNSLAQASISARYQAARDSLVLTSLLHNRFPVNFQLKRGSRSYNNFLRMLAKELRNAESSIHCIADPNNHARIDALLHRLERISLSPDEGGSKETDTEVVDLYRADFEPLKSIETIRQLPSVAKDGSPGLQVLDTTTGEKFFSANVSERAKKFRFFGEKEPLVISGFVDNEPQAPFSLTFLRPMFDDWRSVVMFHPEVTIEARRGAVAISGKVAIPERLRSSLELFVHWGSTSTSIWRDEEIAPFELQEDEGDWLRFEKQLRPEMLGAHGATLCAQVIGTTQRLWLADLGIEDQEFNVRADMLYYSTRRVQKRRAFEADVQSKLLKAMDSFDKFVRTVDALVRDGRQRKLGMVLHQVSREDEELRALISSFHAQIIERLSTKSSGHSRAALKRVLKVLKTIGIGEVVFVTPEGPHAIAGGLAQVIVGLNKALSAEGIPTTVIAPIYDQKQGNKHHSIDELLSEGVVLGDQRVPIELCGEIKVLFGATRIAGTMKQRQFARVVPVQVYRAERGRLRLYLLRHHSLADALYSYSSGEDALRKAVFLARGALELMRSRHFDIEPDTIISNDWLSALVPVYLRCDARYRDFGGFEDVQSIHMLHNAGGAFQGRFYVNEYGEDLWPILNLDDSHFFWLSDPHSTDHLNLTTGAIRHLSGAMLTVSQPYAEELLKPDVGGGLSEVLRERKDVLFGISNGVDTDALRQMYRDLGEQACRQASLPPIFRAKKVTASQIVGKLNDIKQALKNACQKQYGLEQREDAILISMVGRLTSQKGVQLLTGSVGESRTCVLAELLDRYPRTQFLVAGPLCAHDSDAMEFEKQYTALCERYPGRVASLFDFLPHREAMAITGASDLFLMPSQYEPGGITQLEALSAGTSVIGRNVGGIGATLRPYSEVTGRGDSFLFTGFTPLALFVAVQRGIVCMSDADSAARVRQEALEAKHDWSDRVPRYLSLLRQVAGCFQAGTTYDYLAESAKLLSALRPR